MSLKFNRGEAPDQVNVILKRDGFLDDSLQGDWRRIIFKLNTNKVWQISEIHMALKCWRSKIKNFQAEKCP